MCRFLVSLMLCHKTVTWKSHRLRMTIRHGSTPAIARNLEIEWTSTLQHNYLQAVVHRPPAHPEGNRQVSSRSARNRSPNAAVPGDLLHVASQRYDAACLPIPLSHSTVCLSLRFWSCSYSDNDSAVTSALRCESHWRK